MGPASRPDRVAEPSLLPDLVEQARPHRAAEEGGEHGERGPLAYVGGVDARSPVKPEVGLLRIALLHEHASLELGRALGRGRSVACREAGESAGERQSCHSGGRAQDNEERGAQPN